MEAVVENHLSILAMQNNQIGRKEWRAIAGSSRERGSSVDNSEDQHMLRTNGSAKMGANHGFRAETNAASHGLRFHSSGSNGSSSDISEHRLSQEAHSNGENHKYQDEVLRIPVTVSFSPSLYKLSMCHHVIFSSLLGKFVDLLLLS